MDKLLVNLENLTNRNAQFKTVITLNLKRAIYLFTGIAKGIITLEKNGNQGFGYDPIFSLDLKAIRKRLLNFHWKPKIP